MLNFDWKKGLQILGGKYFCPLFLSPFPTFWPILPHITAETQLDLGPTVKFQKSVRYDCSSAMGLGVGKKSTAHPQNQGAPPKTLKNGPNGTKTALFPPFLVGHRSFYPRLQFLFTNP